MTTAVISEYGEFDATALADLLRRGDVSPLELVNEAIRRLEQVNDELNAVVYTMYEHARASAGAAPGMQVPIDIRVDIQVWFAEIATVGEVVGMINHELGVHTLADAGNKVGAHELAVDRGLGRRGRQ